MLQVKSALIVRVIAAFALLLTIVPVRVAAQCPVSSQTAIAHLKCGMPCCAHRAASMTCKVSDHLSDCDSRQAVRSVPHGGLADQCACLIQPDRAVPPMAAKSSLPAATQPQIAAHLERRPDILVVESMGSPGIVGHDAGPPTVFGFVPDLARAPPAA